MMNDESMTKPVVCRAFLRNATQAIKNRSTKMMTNEGINDKACCCKAAHK